MKRSLFVAGWVVALALVGVVSLGASAKKETPATPSWGPGYGGRMMQGWEPTWEPGEPGFMGPRGRGGMRGGMGGAWGQWGWGNVEQLDQPLTLEGAVERAQTAIVDQGYEADLQVARVIQYQSAIYVLVEEKSTGKGAVEILVDPRTGTVGFGPGPSMMWNTKYGHMRWNTGTGTAATTADQAKTLASDWLKQQGDTTAWTMDVAEFYGYYTVYLRRDGRTEAMVSVHAATGQVWQHGGYGAFVAEKEVGG